MVGLEHYLIVAAGLFSIGVVGVLLNRRNVLAVLISLQLMLLSVSLNLVAFAQFQGDVGGQLFAISMFSVSAAELAVGLAILLSFIRNRRSMRIDDPKVMKG